MWQVPRSALQPYFPFIEGSHPVPQSDTANRKFVLAERPKGEPTENTLRLETDDLPKVGAGQMLLRLSLIHI